MHHLSTGCRRDTCVMTGVVLPFLLFFSLSLISLEKVAAQTIYRYSAADRALLLRTKKQEEKAIAAYDRRGMIRIGQAYEGLWKKYKDTSLQAALRCYRFACLTEGDMSPYQLPVAYRLATIYDRGKLVPRNLEDAMAYYFISDTRGKGRLKQLRDSVCGRNPLKYIPAGDFRPGDSVVLQVSPFCTNLHPETRYMLQRLANQLRGMPGWSVDLRADFSYPVMAAPYNLMTVASMWKNMEVIKVFLIEQEGVSADRVEAWPAEPSADAEKGFRIIIRLKEQD